MTMLILCTNVQVHGSVVWESQPTVGMIILSRNDVETKVCGVEF